MKKSQVFLLDWLLLNGSFVLMHVLAGREFSQSYVKLIWLVNGAWLAVGFWEKKTARLLTYRLPKRIGFALRNALFSLYVVAIAMVFLGVTGLSRVHVLGTFVVYGVLITVTLILDQLISRRKPYAAEAPEPKLSPRALQMMLVDLALLILSFGIVHYLKYGAFKPVANAPEVLLIQTAVWFATALFTVKFRQIEERNIYYALSPFIKASLISVAIMSVMVFALRLFRYSRTLIFGTLLLLMILEILVAVWRMVRSIRREENPDIETVNGVKTFIKQHELPIDPEDAPVVVPADVVLQRQALADWPEVYDYLRQKIDLTAMDISLMRVLYTQTLFNIQLIAPQSLRLFVNLHLINDFKRPNEYFLQVHTKLKAGGYFLVRKERLENYRERLEQKFPSYIATSIYIVHFLWHRVCPKLPWLQRFYFFFSGDRNRVMTRAEIIGRLHFCGFRLIHFEHIGDSHWFLVQKTKVPAVDVNPNHGPLIRLRRIGYQGRVFMLHKFRTMHPYAEYLQQYVYETCDLDASGKFKQDFRLTQWGKVMRKYWLDELPQLINYVRGDIRLFGVRAISEHYFSLYPEDVQRLRIQVKPGLIPPYYADMPKNFDEIVESERRYLASKLQKPIRTDIVYFIRAFVNIVFKRAHSK